MTDNWVIENVFLPNQNAIFGQKCRENVPILTESADFWTEIVLFEPCWYDILLLETVTKNKLAFTCFEKSIS